MTLDYSDKKQRAAIIGVVVAIVLFFTALLFSKLLRSIFLLSDEEVLLMSRLALWAGLIILIIYSRCIEKQPLLLWEEKKYSFLYYMLSVISTLLIVTFVLIVFSMIWVLLGFKKESDALNKILEVFKHSHFLILLTCITAGVTEELVFRGYIMSRLHSIFNKPYLSIIISSVIFGLIHFGYGTTINVVGPFIIGLVFGLHYYKYRNIKILIVCHFLWDYAVILLKLKLQHPGQ